MKAATSRLRLSMRGQIGESSYFLIFFLSCFGFLTSFLRTLFPLLMTNSFWLCLPAARTHGPASLRLTRMHTADDRTASGAEVTQAVSDCSWRRRRRDRRD